MCKFLHFSVVLVTFTEEILNGKLPFFVQLEYEGLYVIREKKVLKAQFFSNIFILKNLTTIVSLRHINKIILATN